MDTLPQPSKLVDYLFINERKKAIKENVFLLKLNFTGNMIKLLSNNIESQLKKVDFLTLLKATR